MEKSVLATQRLFLREFVPGDAPFILELLNDPGWTRFIGDRRLRDLEGARKYIADVPAKMYARLGFGLWLVGLRATGEPVGMAGLLKRDTLDDVDLGFALLERYRGRGYAGEAARACIDYGFEVLGLPRLLAIVSPGNEPSARLLAKLGFADDGTFTAPDGEVLRRFSRVD